MLVDANILLYSIDEESRTLTVEHVVIPTENADDFGKVG